MYAFEMFHYFIVRKYNVNCFQKRIRYLKNNCFRINIMKIIKTILI